MKNKLFLILSSICMMGFINTPFESNDKIIEKKLLNNVNEINKYEILNSSFPISVNSVPNVELVNSDFDSSFVKVGLLENNCCKSYPWSVSYYDVFNPNNEIITNGTKINNTDDFYSYYVNDNNFTYSILTKYRSNFYFDDSLSKVKMYIPSFQYLDNLIDILSKSYQKIKIPLLDFNDDNYLSLYIDNGKNYIVSDNNTKLLSISPDFWLIEFDNPEEIHSINLLECNAYHSYFNSDEAKYRDRIGMFIPHSSMNKRCVHLPFEIYDIDLNKSCEIKIIPDSFSALRFETYIENKPGEVVLSDNYIRYDPERLSDIPGDINVINHDEWMSVDSKGQTYIDSIDLNVTNEKSYYDENGVFHESTASTSQDLKVEATQNVGGPSGKFLYDYFPNFKIENKGAGKITLKSFRSYVKCDRFGTFKTEPLNTLDYDLSFVKRFKFTYDNRPVVRVAYWKSTLYDNYYKSLSNRYSGFNSWLNLITKPDRVNQYASFGFYFDKDRLDPISNVQHVDFEYQLENSNVSVPLSMVLNQDYVKYVPSKEIANLIVIPGGEMESKLNSNGMGFITSSNVPQDIKTKLIAQDGFVPDYTFVYSHGTNDPYIQKISPFSIYYLEDKDLSIVSQAVTNELGLHIYDGKVYDKDNNLRLDYEVKDQVIDDPISGDKISNQTIVDKNNNPISPDGTGEIVDNGDNKSDFPTNKEFWDDVVNDVKNSSLANTIKKVVYIVLGILGIGLIIKFLSVFPIHKWIWNLISFPFKKLSEFIKNRKKKK